MEAERQVGCSELLRQAVTTKHRESTELISVFFSEFRALGGPKIAPSFLGYSYRRCAAALSTRYFSTRRNSPLFALTAMRSLASS